MRKTVHRMSQTVHRLPQTVHWMRQTVHPMPQTVHRLPQTVHRMPQTVHRLPQTINRMPQTVHRMPQTVHRMPQTVHRMPQTVHRMPQTVHRMPQTVHRLRQRTGPIWKRTGPIRPLFWRKTRKTGKNRQIHGQAARRTRPPRHPVTLSPAMPRAAPRPAGSARTTVRLVVAFGILYTPAPANARLVHATRHNSAKAVLLAVVPSPVFVLASAHRAPYLVQMSSTDRVHAGSRQRRRCGSLRYSTALTKKPGDQSNEQGSGGAQTPPRPQASDPPPIPPNSNISQST
jgi:uncharacterized protein YoxC